MSDPIARLNAALEGRYRIERELGEGGMATVYLADDLKHERKVALKVLKPELAAVVGADRFLAEIRTTANLQHPHILPLHDSGEADGFLYYVMPYIEGETLRDRLERERQLPVDEAVRIATDVAEALHAAHEQGVIHRDIKPANILLSRGRPLVADFGIALAVSAAGGGRLTETGLSMGTPFYMSPEQASADREPSAASDVYSLGCVLYEMLVGDPPYTASSVQAVLAKILTTDAPAPIAARTSIPANVDAAIRKALEKLPADRFPGAQDFANALGDQGFGHGEGARGPAVRLGLRMRLVLTGAGVLAALLLGFFAGRLGVPKPTAPLTRFPVSPPQGALLSGMHALSPDGEWLVFMAEADGGSSLFRRRLGELEAEEIPGAKGGTAPFFSPDSRWLGFYSDGRLLKVPLTGGPPVPITQTGTVYGASWGDNEVIVFIDAASAELYTVPGAGGAPTPVGGRSEGWGYNSVWMLPGSEAALATLRQGGGRDNRMVVVDLETGAADTLGFATRVTYASGHVVYSGPDGMLLAQSFDAGARRTSGPSVVLLDGLALGPAAMGMFAVSSQGGLAYQSAATASDSLVIVDRGGAKDVLLYRRGNLENPTFSPDGRRIAMGLMQLGDNEHIWILDRDQETLQRLTVEGSRNMYPVWTPDGSRIAFMSHRNGAPGQIYWRSADGSGAAEILLTSDYPAGPGSWSPDGQTLAFWAGRNTSTDIGLVDPGDPTPRWVVESEFDDTQPQFSPDGLWLAYTSNRSGEREVYVDPVSGEGGRVQISFDGGHSPRWAPADDALYYASGSAPGTILAASYTTAGGFRVTSREGGFTVDDDLNPALVGSMNYDVNEDEIAHIIDAGGGAAEGTGLVWVLNWPEIIR